MCWMLEEALNYYKTQGAPREQSALVNLLKEVQRENGGAIPKPMVSAIAEGLETKESLLFALIKRMPSLRLADSHILEVCAGPNCGKAAGLAALAETLKSDRITVKFVPCMRMCGKGPNIKWDGKLYHHANEALLKTLAAGTTR